MDLLHRYHAAVFQLRLFVIVTLCLLLGCATSSKRAETAKEPEPQQSLAQLKESLARQSAQDAANVTEGSLWQEHGELGSLFINPKARSIGDVVTIRIVESSSATNKASTKTGRNSSLSAGVENFFGAETRYDSDSPFFNPFGKVGSAFENDFDGSGTTKRSGDLTAYITARVVDVLPNGNLVVRGVREVMVNSEKQQIVLSGVVRPRDISANNEVVSTYISDAKIAYSGTGIINDKQRPGWLMRALDKVWPF
jgi:flagellar L-ring protein precursor FlgH